MAIFLRKFRCMIKKLTTNYGCSMGSTSGVPSGCFVVYVEEEHKTKKRNVIPAECLSSIMFKALLNQFKEEIEDLHKTRLSCSVDMFEGVVDLVKSEFGTTFAKRILTTEIP